MVSPEEAKRGRRTHRKSRLGCQPCKQRKIKCDERRPVCANCIRRETECSFMSRDPEGDSGKKGSKSGLASASASSPAATQFQLTNSSFYSIRSEGAFYRTLRFVPSTQGYGSNNSKHTRVHCESEGASSKTCSSSPQVFSEQNFLVMSQRIASLESNLQKTTQEEPLGAFTYADMALLHHYFHLPDRSSWDEQLLEAAFQHPPLLHLILGFAALHWARQAPDRKAEFVAQADRHYVIGMRGATKLLSATTEDSIELAYKSAILIGFYNLALGPQPGEYIGFSEHDGEASFLVFLRGVRVINENKEGATQSPPPATFDTAQTVAMSEYIELCIPETSQCATTGYATHFKRLRHLALACPGPLSLASRDASIYHSALDELEPFYKEVYGLPAGPPQARAADAHSRMAFGWLYRVSGGFINRLQGKAPLALAIFACFAVMLKRLETGWVMQGWPEHIMSGVWKLLGPESRDLVRWPIEQMGWEPPVGDGFIS